MTLNSEDYLALRRAIAEIPGDVSNDAVGANVATLDDIFAPESHAAALDPRIPVVLGSRGSGKSFWSGVLGQIETRNAADRAYPRLNLSTVEVRFGYTGVGGPDGISMEAIDDAAPPDAGTGEAKAFWWATVLSAAAKASGDETARPKKFLDRARAWEAREQMLHEHEQRLCARETSLLVVYDALDTIARTWPRRRLLTEALLEVVWAMRAYRAIRLKLFIRPDQLEDDALRFVELPKLRDGAVRLKWSSADLYGLFYARLALTQDPDARAALSRLLGQYGLITATRDDILTRRWPLATDSREQKRLMAALAGPYMGQGSSAPKKKGNTYDWPIKHLADAFEEVTPRSFLRLMIAAAQHGVPPTEQVIHFSGIQHGLRAASKTRVDQLYDEFPWIKGVLAPLAGLLLPKPKEEVFALWRQMRTLDLLREDATQQNYLPPFPLDDPNGERALFLALERIGVMYRRKDERLDMPDLFRVAAKLLKKGGVAP
ncbi:MAG: hypothetical protein R6X17_03385 [Candidatus Competibacteraceae bacterium]